MDLRRSKFYEALGRRLVLWAEHEFELDRPVRGAPGGSSRRAMLEEALRIAPVPHFESQLRNPYPFPEGVGYLWGWFIEIAHTGRLYTDGVALPLSSTELWSWCQLNEIQLQPWERRTIRLLDVAWLKLHNRRDD